jgi:hypothetical protein
MMDGLTFYPSFLPSHNNGLQELILLALVIALLYCLANIIGLFALAKNNAFQANLYTIPTLVTVHDVVATNDRRNITEANFFGGFEKVFHISESGGGFGITAVAEEVDEDMGNTNIFGDFEKGNEMKNVRVLGLISNCSISKVNL